MAAGSVAAQVNGASNGASTRSSTRTSTTKTATHGTASKPVRRNHNAQQAKKATQTPAAPPQGLASAYSTMAGRLANRVAELAESITFVERPKQKESQEVESVNERKRPRKLEMRLGQSSAGQVAFSAPFLDNTLQKMLNLQNRMLKSTAEMSNLKGKEGNEQLIRELAGQSAELSRIIALICAEKARQNG